MAKWIADNTKDVLDAILTVYVWIALSFTYFRSENGEQKILSPNHMMVEKKGGSRSIAGLF